MFIKKCILLSAIILTILSWLISGCGAGGSNQALTFSQLISQANKYNGQTVTLEAFYFSGFEISALSESVGPPDSGNWRIIPKGTLVWVESGISQEIYDKLYRQSDTPSGYEERVGKLKVIGKFETGGKYGHMDAYSYKIAVTQAELLEWTPPPATTTPNGTLQVKVIDSTGKLLDGAKVVSEEQPDGQLKVTGLTGENGTVTFNNIKAGSYVFYVSRADYVQNKLAVLVTGGNPSSATVRMEED
jgi:hypothetical protein